MSVAIVTKYHGPTNYRGARITASVPSRIAELGYMTPDQITGPMDHAAYWRLTISYPYELTSERGHRKAAEELARRLGWLGSGEPSELMGAAELAAGALDSGYAFVFVRPGCTDR